MSGGLSLLSAILSLKAMGLLAPGCQVYRRLLKLRLGRDQPVFTRSRLCQGLSTLDFGRL